MRHSTRWYCCIHLDDVAWSLACSRRVQIYFLRFLAYNANLIRYLVLGRGVGIALADDRPLLNSAVVY
jgi:hypothetical protein